MATRPIALLVALVSLTAAACGSDGTRTGDTLSTTPATDPTTSVTQPPGTDVATTDVPDTVAPTPITSPEYAADPAVQAELDDARARWEAQGSDSYTIVTQSLCFCPIEQWSDTVVDGVVTEHVALSDNTFSDPQPRPMNDLFDMVQQAIDAGYASLDVSYDPDTGALQQFFVDVDTMIADEEYGVEVVSLEPVG